MLIPTGPYDDQPRIPLDAFERKHLLDDRGEVIPTISDPPFHEEEPMMRYLTEEEAEEMRERLLTDQSMKLSECLDLLAYETGLDPAEVRRRFRILKEGGDVDFPVDPEDLSDWAE